MDTRQQHFCQIDLVAACVRREVGLSHSCKSILIAAECSINDLVERLEAPQDRRSLHGRPRCRPRAMSPPSNLLDESSRGAFEFLGSHHVIKDVHKADHIVRKPRATYLRDFGKQLLSQVLLLRSDRPPSTGPRRMLVQGWGCVLARAAQLAGIAQPLARRTRG